MTSFGGAPKRLIVQNCECSRQQHKKEPVKEASQSFQATHTKARLLLYIKTAPAHCIDSVSSYLLFWQRKEREFWERKKYIYTSLCLFSRPLFFIAVHTFSLSLRRTELPTLKRWCVPIVYLKCYRNSDQKKNWCNDAANWRVVWLGHIDISIVMTCNRFHIERAPK